MTEGREGGREGGGREGGRDGRKEGGRKICTMKDISLHNPHTHKRSHQVNSKAFNELIDCRRPT